MSALRGLNILLVISGGIAAYKSLELIRLLRKKGADVRVVMTGNACEFITPMSAGALSENQVYTDLWSLKDETEMGHIALSRQADAIIIAPASADLLAKMANGLADDLASTVLLASDKPVYAAPAMNVKMWENPATQENIRKLRQWGMTLIGPVEGDMACGEYGPGRMSDIEDICAALEGIGADRRGALAGRKALVTSGPTFEAIDPVRYIGNRSSGKQGHAIAAALAQAGADVTLVTGPVALEDPVNVNVVHVESAGQMYAACLNALPVDIAVCAAAVADWRPGQIQAHKLKKDKSGASVLEGLSYEPTPDILHELSTHKTARPSIVAGFAAETENIEAHGQAKLEQKKCDMILINDVGEGRVFGDERNELICLEVSSVAGLEGEIEKHNWKLDSKQALAQRLVDHMINKGFEDDRDVQSAAE